MVYVNDCMMIGNKNEVDIFKEELNAKYKMRHHGSISAFTGMNFTRDRTKGTGTVSMNEYVEALMKEFLPDNIKTANAPSKEADVFTKEDEPTSEEDKNKMA